MINGLHHTNISTPDIDRSIAFYELLGFSVVVRSQWAQGSDDLDRIVGLKDSAVKFALLWTGNTYLEIFEYENPVGRERDPSSRVCDHGITHICLDVTGVDEEYERLTADGMTFNTPPRTIFGVRTTYGQDPDGNVVELQEVLEWEAFKLPSKAVHGPADVKQSA